MSLLIAILTVLLVFVSLFLGLVVLVQKPRSDSGLGTAMGGGMAEATFGSETGNVLTRATIYAAVAFFVIAFGAYLGHIYVAKHSAKAVEGLPTITAPAIPAPEAAPLTTPASEAPAPAAQP